MLALKIILFDGGKLKNKKSYMQRVTWQEHS